MKFPRQDFPLIRTVVILLLTSVVLVGVSIAGSLYLKDLMRQHKQDNHMRMIDARTKLERVREEERKILLYQAQYQQLIKQNIIGKENRLALIENIERIKTERNLFEFSYQIAAQQPVQTDVMFAQSEFGLHGSPMKLSFAVQHEEDWLNALDDLNETGVNLLHECTVTRNDPVYAAVPKLKAECTMTWLSLRQKNGDVLSNLETR